MNKETYTEYTGLGLKEVINQANTGQMRANYGQYIINSAPEIFNN